MFRKNKHAAGVGKQNNLTQLVVQRFVSRTLTEKQKFPFLKCYKVSFYFIDDFYIMIIFRSSLIIITLVTLKENRVICDTCLYLVQSVSDPLKTLHQPDGLHLTTTGRSYNYSQKEN